MDAIIYKDTIYGGGGAMRGNYFNPIIYSTEERVVGVGENDKPLYQKTIESGSIPVDSETTTGLTNIESYHVIAIEVINLSNNTEFSPNQISMYNYQGAGTWYGNVFLANNELKFNNNSRTNAIKVRAVIQYTKTTDVAGSGKYNTLGVPNVHYTTDEQVIGTWIDGKPLYQKTIAIHNESTVSSNTTITTIDSTFRVKNWKAFAIENGVNYKVPYVAGNGNASFYFRENGNVEFTIKDTTFAAGSDFYITIEYTKTTD